MTGQAVVSAGREDRQLDFFFASERLFFRSTMGAQLERAAMQRSLSGGHRLQPKVVWWWRPNGEPPPVYVSSGRGEGGGYELDHNDMVAHSRLSRRMRILAQRSPRAYAVLSVYYGDRGARWARTSQDRFEHEQGWESLDKLISSGLGYGAIVSLYPLTAAGQELLRRERAKSGVKPTERKAVRELNRQRMADHAAHVKALDEAIEKAQHESDRMMAEVEAALLDRDEARKRFAGARANEGRNGRGVHPARSAIQAATQRAEVAIEAHEHAERSLLLLRNHRAHSSAPTVLPNPVPTTDGKATHAENRRLRAAHEEVAEKARKDGEAPPPPPELHPVVASRTPVVTALVAAPAQLSDDEILEVAFLLQRTSPAEGRRLLLTLARNQAEELLREALAEWNLTQEPKKAKQ